VPTPGGRCKVCVEALTRTEAARKASPVDEKRKILSGQTPADLALLHPKERSFSGEPRGEKNTQPVEASTDSPTVSLRSFAPILGGWYSECERTLPPPRRNS